MDQEQINATLQNWEYAGKIAGSAYTDEMGKLSKLLLCDVVMQKEGMTKEALISFVKKLVATPTRRAIGLAAAALGAGGIAGHQIGAKDTQEQVEMQVRAVAPKLFQAGFISGAKRGFLMGAQRMHQALSGKKES
jgi:hypothetical protein